MFQIQAAFSLLEIFKKEIDFSTNFALIVSIKYTLLTHLMRFSDSNKLRLVDVEAAFLILDFNSGS